MNLVRRLSLLATAGLLGIAVLLGWVSARPAMSVGAASEIAAGLSWFDSTIVLARNASPRGRNGDALAVALGYLERERLGLASPFLLADRALRDPRLDSAMAQRVAWTLLGRLRRGEAYVVDPSVLDGMGPWGRDGRGATGSAHLALIERTIASASDPRAGELAVRLAYAVEAGKGTLAASAASVATEAAALVRDRALATGDARDLLTDAAERHEDALGLLRTRRRDRAFRVEQPPMAPLTPELRTEAMNLVPALVARLDSLDGASATAVSGATMSLLGEAFAGRLWALGARQPTTAQVVVTLRSRPQALLRATNDESLAAAFSRLSVAPDSARRTPAMALLSSAVALRAYNQSAPWFTGDAGPVESDLVSEFGLAGVDFSRAVPAAWRPYYLGELAETLRDMQRVFPAWSVDGLRISIGAVDLPDSALAMHDPRTRTLRLNINSSAGTLAHELAHDLDWQTSRRLFAVAGGYSTDRAMHERRSALATSVRGLAEARLLRPVAASGVTARPADRPAELFARGADWYAATSLALAGRTNGFLTAVEDAGLPGYAAGAPTAIGFAGVTSLVSAIDQMTFVSDSARLAFEATWSDASTIDPLVLARRVLGTPVSRYAFSRAMGAPLPAVTPSLCAAEGSAEARARSRLLALAVQARAEGIAMRRARYRYPGAAPEWANGLLGVPPWNPRAADPVIASLASALVTELRSAQADQGVVPEVPASFRSSDASCSAISR